MHISYTKVGVWENKLNVPTKVFSMLNNLFTWFNSRRIIRCLFWALYKCGNDMQQRSLFERKPVML